MVTEFEFQYGFWEIRCYGFGQINQSNREFLPFKYNTNTIGFKKNKKRQCRMDIIDNQVIFNGCALSFLTYSNTKNYLVNIRFNKIANRTKQGVY